MENKKETKKKFKKIKREAIDVHNDAAMVKIGIRMPIYNGRDVSVWSKTKEEKKKLKRMRNNISPKRSLPKKSSVPVLARLIIYLKKNQTFDKTTYSQVCQMSRIPEILRFFVGKSGNNLVSKYVYNGKEYRSDQLPYWNWKY